MPFNKIKPNNLRKQFLKYLGYFEAPALSKQYIRDRYPDILKQNLCMASYIVEI
jgi:hypothetical protein